MVDMLCVCGAEVDRVSRNAGGSDIEGSKRRGGHFSEFEDAYMDKIIIVRMIE